MGDLGNTGCVENAGTAGGASGAGGSELFTRLENGRRGLNNSDVSTEAIRISNSVVVISPSALVGWVASFGNALIAVLFAGFQRASIILGTPIIAFSAFAGSGGKA